VQSAFKKGATRLHLGSFIALGCAVSVLAPSLDTFRTNAHTTISQIGLLISAGSIGYLVGSIMTGRLLQRQPAHRMLGGGLLIIAAALIGLTAVHSLLALAFIEGVLGLGGSMMDVTGNTVVLWVHKGGPVMNALHLAFGIGGILAPVIISRSLVWTSGIRLGYFLIAGAAAVLAIRILQRPSPENPHLEGARGFPKGVTKLIVLAMAFFVSYAWLELGFLSWIATYGQARGLDAKSAAPLLLAAFMAAFSVGRLIAIPVSARVSAKHMMMGDFAICTAGLLIMLAGGANAVAMWGGTILVGLGVASMFPSMLSLSEPAVPSTSSVTSMFLVGSSIGSIFLPPLIGRLIDLRGPVALPQMVLAGTVVCGTIVFSFIREATARARSGAAIGSL
jgi:fucose permease